MSKDKSVKATIRHMMTLDIHHPKHVSSTNRQINRLLHKEIQNGSSNEKLCRELIELTDEIAILADAAVQAKMFARINISKSFSDKQEKLKELYEEYAKTKK